MGLLTAEGRINAASLDAVATAHAGLFFDQLHDSCGDWAGTLSVCRRLIDQALLIGDRQVLLLISVQYDALVKPLPEVIWWISGSEELRGPFIQRFVRRLEELCEDIDTFSGGGRM